MFIIFFVFGWCRVFSWRRLFISGGGFVFRWGRLFVVFGWNGFFISGRRVVFGFIGGGGRWFGFIGRRRIVVCIVGFFWRSGIVLGEGDVVLGVLYDFVYVYGVLDGVWDMLVI